MHLTIKDTAKMRRMGYTVKAMYETAKGIPSKVFHRVPQMVQGWWLGQKGVLER